jgi:hypothetical protein
VHLCGAGLNLMQYRLLSSAVVLLHFQGSGYTARCHVACQLPDCMPSCCCAWHTKLRAILRRVDSMCALGVAGLRAD